MPAVLQPAKTFLIVLLIHWTQAMVCFMGCEPDPTDHQTYRWVIPVEDPCRCIEIRLGGLNTYSPVRDYKVTYFNTYCDSMEDIKNMLKCPGEVDVCLVGQPLGMESDAIPDANIEASSVYESSSDTIKYQSYQARLNNIDQQAWAANEKDTNPWIRVDFEFKVYVTSLTTQGRDSSSENNEWVETYNVAHSDDDQHYSYVTDVKGAPALFTGNNDINTPVTAMLGVVLHTRYLRIMPIACHEWCSIRFEVIGCRKI